uniref:Ubiquitin-related modifier 1 n=1 Tax=Naja naja TaxID=35670 RepID=A0A8C6YGS4_NAJNA
MAAPLSVQLEFGGGAELLFDGVRKHQVNLPGQSEPWNLRHLLMWIKENLLKERPELFVQGESVATWNINCKIRTTWFSSPPYTGVRLPAARRDNPRTEMRQGKEPEFSAFPNPAFQALGSHSLPLLASADLQPAFL